MLAEAARACGVETAPRPQRVGDAYVSDQRVFDAEADGGVARAA